MKREVKTFEYECDFCKRTERVTDLEQRIHIPEGWGLVLSHGHGMTGYTASYHACSECYKARQPS